ncbi:MAG: lipopolysaccharide biosynthesis protein [Burkholderiales bacterium]
MRSIVSGALLVVAMRWTDRLIGFLSTLILARLLLPDDFGVIAMASVIIGLVDVLLNLGVHVPLIQNKNPTQAHYDTAWTLRILQSAATMLLIIVSAPFAARYFNEPRIVDVMMVLAMSLLVGALENIGVVNFQKEMRFAEDFRFLFLRRILAFVVTLVFAFALKSYWALVIGTVIGRIAGVVLSYTMHPMRPRLSLATLREIFSVSQWMLMRNITGYLETRLHLVVVGGREDSATTGAYGLADEVASLPTTELLAPLNRVLFPAFVAVKDNLDELRRIFLLSLSLQSLIGIPAGLGLALVAEQAVPVLLGPNWNVAIPFLQVIAIVNVFNAIGVAGIYVMFALDRVRLTAYYALAQVLVFAAGAYLLFPGTGAFGISLLRMGSAALLIGVFLVMLTRILPGLRLAEMGSAILRPSLATALMIACVYAGGESLGSTAILVLIVKIAIGIVVYCAAITTLWWAAGRPPGAEQWLLDNLGGRFRRNTST